jgi:hypothetical protein
MIMRNEPSDGMSTEFDDLPTDVATMEAAAEADATVAEWTGPRCEKCEAPIKSDVVTVCRSCGWYASLGTFVEVDPNWETDDDANKPAAAAPQKSHLRVWLDLLPRWSWVIIATLLAVVIESVVVRLVTPTGSGLRTSWSLWQLAIGIVVFVGCHIFNFLVLAAGDADVGLMDLVLKPLKLWMRAVHNLPTRLWVSNSAASGVMAAAMSLLVIGGIPYERFWDWGIDAPVKQDLMGAVMDRVKKLESQNGADNLEDAIGDFAGKADELTEPTPPKHREKADCVILGYQVDRNGRLDTLVLGTNYLAKLVFACRIKPEMSQDELAQLLDNLSRIRTHQPLIAIQGDSTIWVKPHYACRVNYAHREKGQLRDVTWNRMLGRIGQP